MGELNTLDDVKAKIKSYHTSEHKYLPHAVERFDDRDINPLFTHTFLIQPEKLLDYKQKGKRKYVLCFKHTPKHNYLIIVKFLYLKLLILSHFKQEVRKWKQR